MIQIQSAGFSYTHAAPVFREISARLDSCHCVAILGNNGAGKSTLLRCMNRILKLDTGKIVVCERDLDAFKRKEIAQTLSYVEQHSAIYEYTVFDAVLLGRKPYIRIEPTSKDLEIVKDTIARLGLEPYALRLLTELSGGEVQKVMIARALAQQPKVLLLDEPTSNLDLKNQHEVMRLVSDIAKQDHILVIVVIHDLNLAVRYCDRFLLLHDGGVYAFGDASVLTDEALSAVYGIHAQIVEVNGEHVVLAKLDEQKGEKS